MLSFQTNLRDFHGKKYLRTLQKQFLFFKLNIISIIATVFFDINHCIKHRMTSISKTKLNIREIDRYMKIIWRAQTYWIDRNTHIFKEHPKYLYFSLVFQQNSTSIFKFIFIVNCSGIATKLLLWSVIPRVNNSCIIVDTNTFLVVLRRLV